MALEGRLADAALHPLDHAALRAARVRFPAVGLADGGPLPLSPPWTDATAAAAASARAAGSQYRQDGRTRSSSVRSTGVPSTGAGSSAVGSIPPAAVLSSVARPSGPTVPNTV
ncbi:hypothetical protein JYK04_08191 [Streptomyces nojiriensis]|nr:hypothetical protein JYK04_08191 [Streptomyces nojiriensis]